MDAIIITIGDELLVGQTIDTNSAHIAKELYQLGIQINEIVSISDTEKHIVSTLDRVLNTAEFIIITGGLGPTNDDITKKVLTNYFKDELVIYPAILERIQAFFSKLNKPILEVNRMQALLPKNAKIIENELGTASGMLFHSTQSKVLSLPGVPYEMKGLLQKFTEYVKAHYAIGNFYHRTLQVIGIGESYLAELISDWEIANRQRGISVSYLPSVGTLKLRLTGRLDQKAIIDQEIISLSELHSKYIIGGEFDTIERVIGKLLIQRGETVGTVESCTGGSIARKIVSSEGSSAYFLGSIVSYTNILKQELVGVNHETLATYGAVSQGVVEQMAENGRRLLGVDYCISVSGIAGPTGGSDEKPVGTVWIGVASPTKTYSKKFNFGHTRERNIQASVLAGLNFLRLILTDHVD